MLGLQKYTHGPITAEPRHTKVEGDYKSLKQSFKLKWSPDTALRGREERTKTKNELFLKWIRFSSSLRKISDQILVLRRLN